jgi:NADH-quinone oxidoreductase subunit A
LNLENENYFCPPMHSYLPVAIFFLGGLLFIGLGFGVSLLLQTRKPNPQKGLAYECGEEPSAPGGRFNIRYFLPAAVFLLFEVEVVLLAPVLISAKNHPPSENPGQWLQLVRTEALGFTLVLAAGLLLALGLGYLNWDKPVLRVPDFFGPVPDFAYEQYNLEQEQAEANKPSARPQPLSENQD